MSLWKDMLQELPLSAVMKERVALAEQKYELLEEQVDSLKRRIANLERENAELRSNVPKKAENSISAETARVLLYLFEHDKMDECVPSTIASYVGVDKGVVQYHLDCLSAAGMAQYIGFSRKTGEAFWGLMPNGRKYAVETLGRGAQSASG